MYTNQFNSKFNIGDVVFRQERGELVETKIVGLSYTVYENGRSGTQYYYHPFNPNENDYKQIINEENLMSEDEVKY